MSNPQFQRKTVKSKSSPYQALFKQPVTLPKNLQFQQVYQMINNDRKQATKKCFIKNDPKNTEILKQAQQNLHIEKKNNQASDLMSKKAIIKKAQEDIDEEIDKKRLRALSSKKFDCIIKKRNSKRSKKFTHNLLQYVKMNEMGSSNSKKSTDNSNSEEIEKIKSENELISQFIKAEQQRIKQLEKQIHEEKKKHQSQKQLYHLKIDKLKKKVCGVQDACLREIEEFQQSFLSEGGDCEEYDTLSIDSR